MKSQKILVPLNSFFYETNRMKIGSVASERVVSKVVMKPLHNILSLSYVAQKRYDLSLTFLKFIHVR